ncbi:MAG: CopG family transcriptional regulator [Candidatus Hydrogenedentes bacterium]|nr:CopG family transcriptional regulator [Candidatus Hydrogenedentota bacterium]
MRTTITIDDDLLAAAKYLALAKSQTVGRVISDLARRGLGSPTHTVKKNKKGFPAFDVRADSRVITLEDVKKYEDEL